tara:strand:+ start:1176 stop:3695 length:2520 start_codon:yes stop_codon:yes gene_type:complete
MPIWSPAMIFGSAASGYVIEGSGSFNGTDGKLTRTISSAGNRKKFILEVIFKRGSTSSSLLTAYSSGTDTFYFYLSGGQVYVQNYESATQMELKSDAVLKDFTAWYHLIVAINTEQSTETNRVKAWVNGVELTWVSSPRTYPAEDASLKWNTGSQEHQIGHSSTTYSSDYFARAASYDGQTMTDPATDGFGEYDDNGVWVPLNVSGKDFGTTGFLIEGGAAFTNGTDSSGNSQNFTKGGTITNVNDTLTDKASDNFGNYATINLGNMDGGAVPVISNGLTTFTRNGTGSDNQQAYATQVAVGKKYWEFLITGNSNSVEVGWAAQGIQDGNQGQGPTYYGAEVYLLQMNAAGGSAPFPLAMIEGASGSAASTTTSLDSGEITTTPRLKFAIDTDAKKYFLGVIHGSYGGWLNTSGVGGQTFDESAPTGTYTSDEQFLPFVFAHAQTGAGTFYFRDADWSDSAPSGYTALSTANIPDTPTVTNPSDFFKTVLYTGNGSTLSKTGVGFRPDFVWIKCRSVATNWNVVDVVRGDDAMLRMASSTNTEQSGANQEFESFDADGFTVTHHGGVVEELNRSSATYVAYCMKAGGSASTIAAGSVSTGVPTIASSVSAASHGGFSIGTFTAGSNGAITIGHGLSRAPGMIIVKDRESTGQYWTFHESFGATKYVALNATADAAANSAVWNDTAPTASVFSTQDNGAWLTAGNDHVFYAFAKTPGLIGIGSYTGNGAADGPYVVIDDGAAGFRPAWLMIKEYDGSNNGSWFIRDSVRNPYNPTDLDVYAQDYAAEYTDTNSDIDFTANGFKIRSTAGGYNQADKKNLYLAFAENPFGGDGVAQAKGRP